MNVGCYNSIFVFVIIPLRLTLHEIIYEVMDYDFNRRPLKFYQLILKYGNKDKTYALFMINHQVSNI